MLTPALVTDRTSDLHRTVLAVGKERRPIHLTEDLARPVEQAHMVIAERGKLSGDEEVVAILLNDTWVSVAEGNEEILKIELMTL